MIIDVLPIGEVNPALIQSVYDYVRAEFSCGAQTLSPIPIGPGIFDPKRNQYNSALLMQSIAAHSSDKLLAITEADLFIPMLTFVFGQAQLSGRTAIVSLARLRPTFYGLPDDEPLVLERLRKEVAHELGHTFGLIHCADRACIMSLATGIQNVDLKSTSFCPTCHACVCSARPWRAASPPRSTPFSQGVLP